MATSTVTQPAFTAEFASSYKDMMLGRIEQERKTTRRVIASIPNQKLDYRPDPKSRTALELAHHLVVSELWFLESIANGRFDWKDPEPAGSVAEVLAAYDQGFQPALERAKRCSGEHLINTADFFGMKMPTFTFIQFCQDHTVHHRGQLSTYLRAMGGKVPDIYGGSADEPWQPK